MMESTAIQPHNTKVAATWDAGGQAYDAISEAIADSIEHRVVRLAPRPGERVLDIATGTGWAARRMAIRGADVVGIDLGADLIEAARTLSVRAALKIDYRVGDAEQLPFSDESFDVVMSTFGVMFVTRPPAAAAELARVCKKGGRLGLTAWVPEGTIPEFFAVARAYMPTLPEPAPPSPFEWGKPERVRELLGAAFDLRFEPGTTVLRKPSAAAVWEMFVAGFGPTKTLASTLEPQRREQFRQDFVAFHDRFRNDLGIAMPREYLLAIGIRK